MKRLATGIIINLILSVTFVNCSFAETVSLSISCTIPAIPGVNAPLIEEKSTKAEKGNIAPLNIESQPQTQQPEIIQQENYEQGETSEEAQPTVLVKTFYSR